MMNARRPSAASRRPLRRRLPLGALLLGAALAAPAAAAAQRATPTQVYVIRHAEKADDGTNDPALSPAGQERARVLAQRMASVDLAAVYATQFRRTRMTAEPTARAAGLEVKVQEARGGRVAEDARALAERIMSEHRGRSVLVVGHSNTVPAILEALVGVSPGQIGDDDYDDLFMVEIPLEGEPRGRHETVGAPTPAGPSAAPRGAQPRQPSPAPSTPQDVGGKKSLAEVIEKVIAARGLETAVEAYGELLRYSRLSYDFSESELEGLGRRYLAAGEALKAAVVFEMNASTYSESPAAFLSLADAYRALDDRERAVAVYRFVLKLDPDNAAAKRGLAELGG